MSAPAGWYTDPQVPQQLRYFDGSSWTAHTQPAPGSTGSASSPQPDQQGHTAQPWQAGQQGQAGQPGQAGQYQGGSQPGSYQQPAQFEQEPAGSSKVVTYWILGALAGIIVLTIAIFALGGDAEESGVSDAVADLIDEDYDCEQLSADVIDTLADEPDDVRLVGASDLTEVENNIATVEVPSVGEDTILACDATAEIADGTTLDVRLELLLDSNGDLLGGYSER